MLVIKRTYLQYLKNGGGCKVETIRATTIATVTAAAVTTIEQNIKGLCAS